MKQPTRVFVTGANGFIGRALIARLNVLGIETCGVDLTADPARNVVAGNIAMPGPWQQHARGCDVMFHTAAIVSNTAAPSQYREISVGGVRQALDAAVQNGVPRFVHLSSIAAYGLDFDEVQTERHPITVLSGFPYCDSKAASEHPVLAAHAAGEISATIIRPGDVYGPGSRPWVVIPMMLLKKRQFLLPANGHGIFSPVYIDNLIDGLMLAASHSAAVGQIFNITDGIGVECREFFSNHQRWCGRRGAPLSLPTPLAGGVTRLAQWSYTQVLKQPTEISVASIAMLARRATYSIEKATTMLGYQPRVGLDEGMRITGEWVAAGAF